MSKQEIEIIKKLSATSSRPSPKFKEELLSKLLVGDQPPKERRNFMLNTKLIYALSFVLLAVVGVGTFNLLSNDDTQQVAVSENLPINDSESVSLSTSLPSVSLETFEEAQTAVDFTLYQPSLQLSEESISSIEKIDSFLGDGQDSIAMKYADSTGTLYRVSQSKFIGAPPEDAEDVKITFLGVTYTAKFAQILTLGEEDENSESLAYGDDNTPSSFLSWEADGIGYEISEFGRVSKAQLVSLVESMQ